MNTPAPIPTSTAAIVSLVAGILAWVLAPLLGAIIAVVAGHVARSEIRLSAGTLQGDGMAVAGLVLGYLQFLFGLLAVLLFMAVFGGLIALGALGG
jgi:hypothetical protein